MRKVVVLSSVLAVACFFAGWTEAAFADRVKRTDGNTYYRAPNNAGGKTIVIPIGTTFEGRISNTVSSAKSHPGQGFEIVMSSPVLANGIDVVIPAGSAIIGEVVEAVPSSSLPRKKRQPPPRGKLRVQLNGLRTPDGVSYPMVASLAGEVGGRSNNNRTPMGTGVAYMGSAASFEAVGPGMSKLGRGGNGRHGPELVKRRELLKDEIYGLGEQTKDEDTQIRSLVVRRHDYWIDSGSPLTVRLAAPLKLAVTKPGEGAPLGSVEDRSAEDLPAPSLRRQSAPESSPLSSPLPQQQQPVQQPPSQQPASTDF